MSQMFVENNPWNTSNVDYKQSKTHHLGSATTPRNEKIASLEKTTKDYCNKRQIMIKDN